MNTTLKRLTVLTALFLPQLASANVIGFLDNFDVINTTGKQAYGFEIELEGLSVSDITDTFGGPGRGFPTTVERYGAPTITSYSGGVKVTYMASYNAGTQTWSTSTPDISTMPTFTTGGESCWTGGLAGYGASTPCDHFGVGTTANPTKTNYSWLVESSPGVLTNGVVNLPAPTYTVTPQAPVNGVDQPPVVVAQIEAPEVQGPYEFSDALWVKVFTTELDHQAELEDLVGGNPIIQDAKNNTEIEWQLLQYDINKGPFGPGNGQLELGLGAPVGPNAESIIRRYEFYLFGGEYDPETHEAILIGNDSNPGEGDVGMFIGAQNGAVNLNYIPGQVAAVPLPPSALLSASSLALFGLARRRKFTP